MIISLSPQICDLRVPDIERDGDALIIDGTRFDFSQLAEGDALAREATASPYFAGEVRRQDGQVLVPILFPIDELASDEMRFPVPFVDPPNGRLELPRVKPREIPTQ
ncbi:hypothetical protein LMG26854_05335 [Achromobacter aegrifaciens]|uniref:hypothetical protein n=1 Tax=Achromobacter TaxID=222 RepID=UPI001468F610|nr:MULTISPECIES: hypothetical protein [Achromobacter]MBD9476201.1 hypothetical protein [Achromobacter sp. ACM01]CAB3897742.1 hypothetical protein LMG26854_05335 [Achromobacter aegrifaciens]